MLLQFQIPDFHFAIFILSNQCIGPVSVQTPWESVGVLAKLCQDCGGMHVTALPGVCCHILEDQDTTVAKAYMCQWYISPVAKHCCYLIPPHDLTHLAQLARQQVCQVIACHRIWSRGRNVGLHSEICWPWGRKWEMRAKDQYRTAESLALRTNRNCFSFCKFVTEDFKLQSLWKAWEKKPHCNFFPSTDISKTSPCQEGLRLQSVRW